MIVVLVQHIHTQTEPRVDDGGQQDEPHRGEEVADAVVEIVPVGQVTVEEDIDNVTDYRDDKTSDVPIGNAILRGQPVDFVFVVRVRFLLVQDGHLVVVGGPTGIGVGLQQGGDIVSGYLSGVVTSSCVARLILWQDSGFQLSFWHRKLRGRIVIKPRNNKGLNFQPHFIVNHLT